MTKEHIAMYAAADFQKGYKLRAGDRYHGLIVTLILIAVFTIIVLGAKIEALKTENEVLKEKLWAYEAYDNGMTEAEFKELIHREAIDEEEVGP